MAQSRLFTKHCRRFLACCFLMVSFIAVSTALSQAQRRPRTTELKVIQLPAPKVVGSMSLEEAINSRRSVRQFADKPLSFVQIGQLCWAGQGITEKQQGLRAAPSAGALYPIELYIITPEGMFIYRPTEHSLEQVGSSDLRKQLSLAAEGQRPVAEAACSIVITGSVRKVAAKYGNKATKFMLLEAGHVAENIQLQAVAMGLAALPVGAFNTRNLSRVCEFRGELEPLLIVCVGYPLSTSQSGTQQSSSTASGKKAVFIVPSAEFRDEELFETQRILTEAGVESVISSTKIGPLRGMLGGIAASEVTLEDLHVSDYDAVIFVGGTGAVQYFTNPAAQDIAREAASQHKVLAAISIAPTILANAGVLNDTRATGFVTQREAIQKGGAKYTGRPIERDGLIITASGPAAATTFARTIVAAVLQEQQSSRESPQQRLP